MQLIDRPTLPRYFVGVWPHLSLCNKLLPASDSVCFSLQRSPADSFKFQCEKHCHFDACTCLYLYFFSFCKQLSVLSLSPSHQYITHSSKIRLIYLFELIVFVAAAVAIYNISATWCAIQKSFDFHFTEISGTIYSKFKINMVFCMVMLPLYPHIHSY